MISDIIGLVLLYYGVGLGAAAVLTLVNYVAFAKRSNFVEENKLWSRIDKKYGIKTRTIVSFTSMATLLTAMFLLTAVNTGFAVVLGTMVGFLLFNVMLDSNTLRSNMTYRCGVCEHEAQISVHCSKCEHNKKTGINPLKDVVFALKTIKNELK
ncbi:MAG: hypothetical protein LBH74_04590 [Nitrososphaerota archaeon]|uniref:hypothetical protein n=1 Tax=Candidatus Bathycorpusculum sp. TaxID=2994959 RepID=UPI00282C50E9|nr:hypothetical protein [Candidatus Termitimicrobium sp.]MCL2431451.1 hypothetical protein [Candidatus Termitimicrobium sp.]MDR0492899.1 hypothetical protein [Nitrososphaerota archaeon]